MCKLTSILKKNIVLWCFVIKKIQIYWDIVKVALIKFKSYQQITQNTNILNITVTIKKNKTNYSKKTKTWQFRNQNMIQETKIVKEKTNRKRKVNSIYQN